MKKNIFYFKKIIFNIITKTKTIQKHQNINLKKISKFSRHINNQLWFAI
jgi:hypothetical protein